MGIDATKRWNRIGFYSCVSHVEKLTASGCDETETIYYEPGFTPSTSGNCPYTGAMIRHSMDMVRSSAVEHLNAWTDSCLTSRSLPRLNRFSGSGQRSMEGEEKVVVMFGGLHNIEMAALKTIGDWLECS